MGGAATKEATKEDEIKRLERELHAAKTGVVVSGDASAGAPGPSTKQRRGEVSAEVLIPPSEEDAIANSYEKKVVPKDDAVKELIHAAVEENPLFKELSPEERDECVDAFDRSTVSAGEFIIQQGGQGNDLYIIETGSFEILVVGADGGDPVNYGQLAAGRSFGELAIMYNAPRAASIRALSDAVVWSLSRSVYKAITIHHKVLKIRKFIKNLADVPLLQSLSKDELWRIAGAFDEERYEAGEVIIRQGENGDHFYIMENGEVEVTVNGKPEGSITHGGFFGEKALLTEDVRAATITATTNCLVLSMDRNHFINLLGSLQDLISRPDGASGSSSTQQVAELTRAAMEKDMGDHDYHVDIAFSDLEVLTTLGEGAFGRVKLVKNGDSTYALKCMAKQNIIDSNLEEHVVQEKNVMLALNHPHLLRLHNCYQDSRYVYLLIELALGGEMFTLLRNEERFDEKTTKFYTASVILGFEHMHDKHIIYRDLKPENLLLDSDGFLKIADFGLAKVCTDRTYTLCGTPDYLAPEIILSKGHDKAVDYWALGVLIFEMHTGQVPFYSEDPMEVYQLILGHDYSFPRYVSKPCKELVKKLLEEHPGKRLGNLKDGTRDVIKSRWFSGFHWDSLLDRSMEPPIIPQVGSSTDVSNFEEVEEEETEAPESDWTPDF